MKIRERTDYFHSLSIFPSMEPGELPGKAGPDYLETYGSLDRKPWSVDRSRTVVLVMNPTG